MTHIRTWMLAAILTICGTMNGFAQQPEVKKEPGEE